VQPQNQKRPNSRNPIRQGEVMGLTRNDILNLGGQIPHKHHVPGFGEVYVKQVTGSDFDFVRHDNKGNLDQRGMFARLVVAGLCDEDGKPLFKRSDVAAVNDMPFGVLKTLSEIVQDHSGITDDDTDDALGNSEPTTPNDSGTD
jgi:hypothetical protein